MKNKPLSPEQLEDARRLKALFDAKKKQLGYSQESLGHAVGMGQSAVAAFLNGVKPLNVKNAAAFASALRVQVQDFSRTLAMEIAGLARTIGQDEFGNAKSLINELVPVMGEVILNAEGMAEVIDAPLGWVRIFTTDIHTYSMRIKGDNLWPRVHSGEYAVIEPSTDIQQGDEVFVRTKNGKNMIKIMNKTRDGNYQFTSITSEQRPITMDAKDIEEMHFIAAIVKSTRYIDNADLPPNIQARR